MSGDTLHPYYPFDRGYFTSYKGKAKHPAMVVHVEGRLHRVRKFNVSQCRAALANERLVLQKTVVRRIAQRLSKLGETP